ncbi:hypothetical protein KIN20_023297 [Parelaphostrongylus tenuis]|uniref:Uncharacterized protein n=1 Tax=Parelaphostrongylus tenuis TaxID=148309 RepID=A0AAD5QVS2_PARTN|nr:hypothetical protein KIN20_023297 [Parelaphostrongylus tenuis]
MDNFTAHFDATESQSANDKIHLEELNRSIALKQEVIAYMKKELARYTEMDKNQNERRENLESQRKSVMENVDENFTWQSLRMFNILKIDARKILNCQKSLQGSPNFCLSQTPKMATGQNKIYDRRLNDLSLEEANFFYRKEASSIKGEDNVAVERSAGNHSKA